MRKLSTATAVALLGMSTFAMAGEDMHAKDKMKSMDMNGDGMLSKDEFMSYNQKKWDGMKKDANGMVDIKSMSMDHDSTMKSPSDSPQPK